MQPTVDTQYIVMKSNANYIKYIEDMNINIICFSSSKDKANELNFMLHVVIVIKVHEQVYVHFGYSVLDGQIIVRIEYQTMLTSAINRINCDTIIFVLNISDTNNVRLHK